MSTPETIILVVLAMAAVLVPGLLGYYGVQGSHRALAVSRWLTAVLVAAVTVPLGTVMLVDGQPNVWLASGAAVYLYTWALHQLAKALWPQGSRRFRRLRAWFIAQMVACALGAIGGALYGGALGTLGALGALAWFVFSLWLVQLLTRTIHGAAPTTPR